jgi:hypothetical protein
MRVRLEYCYFRNAWHSLDMRNKDKKKSVNKKNEYIKAQKKTTKRLSTLVKPAAFKFIKGKKDERISPNLSPSTRTPDCFNTERVSSIDSSSMPIRDNEIKEHSDEEVDHINASNITNVIKQTSSYDNRNITFNVRNGLNKSTVDKRSKLYYAKSNQGTFTYYNASSNSTF